MPYCRRSLRSSLINTTRPVSLHLVTVRLLPPSFYSVASFIGGDVAESLQKSRVAKHGERLTDAAILVGPYNMASRKRKADDDNDEMSVSPTSSPAISTRQIARASKKAR